MRLVFAAALLFEQTNPGLLARLLALLDVRRTDFSPLRGDEEQEHLVGRIGAPSVAGCRSTRVTSARVKLDVKLAVQFALSARRRVKIHKNCVRDPAINARRL
jgi:hypothetical protein